MTNIVVLIWVQIPLPSAQALTCTIFEIMPIVLCIGLFGGRPGYLRTPLPIRIIGEVCRKVVGGFVARLAEGWSRVQASQNQPSETHPPL